MIHPTKKQALGSHETIITLAIWALIQGASSGWEAELVNFQGFSGVHDSRTHYDLYEQKKPQVY